MDKELLKRDFDEFVKTGWPFDGGQSSANATQVGGAHFAYASRGSPWSGSGGLRRAAKPISIAPNTEKAYTTTKFTPKGITWVAGEWGKYKLTLGDKT